MYDKFGRTASIFFAPIRFVKFSPYFFPREKKAIYVKTGMTSNSNPPTEWENSTVATALAREATAMITQITPSMNGSNNIGRIRPMLALRLLFGMVNYRA
jgi:hypothetical protein